ncbi:cytochrome P450 monooxygenase-like protein [Ilyonectria destructans]|nr:cytochrome P450 monooxygenase-like protein [Ilyonectria destructans]
MSAPILLALIVGLVALPIYYIWCLVSNYSIAKRIGLRTVIVPGNLTSPVWLLLGPRLAALERWLNGGQNRLLRYGWLGFDFKEKARVHLEMGDAFVIVTPGKNYVYLADSVAINHVFQTERRGDYVQPHEAVDMLSIFGPSISTAEGIDWQRHRRATAGSFNELTNNMVWTESLRQSHQILETCLACGDSGTNAIADIARQFALNVLMRASFGKAYDFQFPPESQDAIETAPSAFFLSSKRGEIMDYRESLQLILKNCILIVALGPRFLEKWGDINSKLLLLGRATRSFRHHLDAMYEESRLDGKQQELRANLMAYLVRSSTDDKLLTQEEVRGNMFIYAFAGHDTMAHGLAFTLVLMAAHPEVQDWIREELQAVLSAEHSEWSYESFGRLKRTLSVQYETMRLFNPIAGLMKGTPKTRPAQLPLSDGRTVTLPADTPLCLNINGLHAHPKYWGSDAEQWRPSRWITTDEKGEEQLIVPEKGSFIAWSDGMRGCPGKKFAHVEHVAAMAELFRDHRVSPVLEEGETAEEANARIENVARDAAAVLNVQMKHPERARVVWNRV